jgi:ubiquinone/menaquinone biosynthesis C-methylase UbiE
MENKVESVCPWWIGYILACPLRKLMQNPEKILKPYIKEGMTILDVGSAMGFFSLPMAKMAGEKGKVICVDLQQKMLDVLVKKAGKKGLAGIIEPHLCSTSSLLLESFKDKIDFALASAVMHEIPDKKKAFSEVYNALKPGTVMFVAEPAGHVSEEAFKHTLFLAEEAGFKADTYTKNGSSLIVVLRK